MEIAGIGYQGRSVDGFVAALRDAGIETVVDVRERPASRKPGFSKRGLEACLARAGIGYVHLRAAGNPGEIRHHAASTAEALARYRAHLLRDPAVLGEILALAERRRIALLCVEAARADCHRSVLLEELVALRPDLRTRDL